MNIYTAIPAVFSMPLQGLQIGTLIILSFAVVCSCQNAENSTAADQDSFLQLKHTYVIYGFGDGESHLYTRHSMITVPDTFSLEKRLKRIAESLSDSIFNGLPIEVSGIDVENGKRIVAVNLAESTNENSTRGWHDHYFQGTLGGRATSAVLIRTFLQPELGPDWVDGVCFNYAGASFEATVWDHIPDLLEISYRDRLQ